MAKRQWSIGDRVSFLNEVGGGVVLAVQAADRMLVRTDDGFEMEYATSALVHLGQGNDQNPYAISDHQAKMVAANDRMDERVRKDRKATGSLPKAGKAAKQPDPHAMEIDLHLHELVDNEGRMDPGEKLEYQLAYFERMLNTAIRDKKRTLIVIHGVGEGKLREEVRKILQFYEGIRFDDADPRRYGYGATEVTLR